MDQGAAELVLALSEFLTASEQGFNIKVPHKTINHRTKNLIQNLRITAFSLLLVGDLGGGIDCEVRTG